MKLNEISDREGATKSRKRVGRGIGSGKGKTGGRGVKGQKSRSGVAINGFEGGQMPIYRRLPKRGFSNAMFTSNLNIVSCERLQTAVDAGKLDAKKPVTVEALVEAGVVRRPLDGVRILSDGEIKAKLDCQVHGASKAAIEKIEKAGGKVNTGVASQRAVAEAKAAEKAAKKAAAPKKAVSEKKPAAKKAAKADKPSFVDDIVLIDGIGDKTAEAMKAEGVTALTQIVAMSDDDLAALAEKVGAAGKHESDEWKVQAQEMIDGKPPRAKVDQELAKKLAKK